MAQQDSIAGTTDNGEQAIACALDPAGFATQSERWAHLQAGAAVERVETKDGLCVVFRAESGVEQELRQLVAVESECCSWASWTVEVSGNRLTLRISSTGEGIAVIHSMFATPPC